MTSRSRRIAELLKPVTRTRFIEAYDTALVTLEAAIAESPNRQMESLNHESPNGPMPIKLTPSQRSQLKAKAHALEPVVQVGAAGATDKVIAEIDRSLTAHGLIKVRLAGADRETRDELAQVLSERTDAAVVQQVGRVLVLWRPRPDEPHNL